jgi:hypothetical protein
MAVACQVVCAKPVEIEAAWQLLQQVPGTVTHQVSKAVPFIKELYSALTTNLEDYRRIDIWVSRFLYSINWRIDT